MQSVCDILEQLLAEGLLANYAIGGATAAGFHGEPLATRDIDVFVFLDPKPQGLLVTLDPIFRRLSEMGFSTFEEEGILLHGFPVQFLCASNSLETEAVENAAIAEWDHHRLRVMRPEHLAAIAISVARPKDRARVVYLLSLPEFDRSRFAAILERNKLLSRWQNWANGLGLEQTL